MLFRSTFIDLFAGIGGFHIALSSFGASCVFASEWDKYAADTYEANFNKRPFGDITQINETDIPAFDVLLAGFPCQPFSIAGNGEGFEDTEKGNLFYDILKVIDGKMPKMCMLENVKNLKTHDQGRTYETIETELKNRGYLVTSRCCNAIDYGSPQARTRIFIIGTKMPFIIPEPTIDRKSTRLNSSH